MKIKKRKWRWVGHTLKIRKFPETITRQINTWNVEGRGEDDHLAKRHWKRNKGNGIGYERDEEDGHKQTTVAFLGRWLMLSENKHAYISEVFHQHFVI